MSRSAGKPVIVDPKGLEYSRYEGATLLTPNLSEFEAVVGKCNSLAQIEKRGIILCQNLKLTSLLVTLGDKGMIFVRPNYSAIHLEANTKEVFDVTGAGDTVIAALALAIAKSLPFEDAVNLSNVAAGIVVSKAGTATVYPYELAHGMQADSYHSLKICDEKEITQLVIDAQEHGETVVMTNGCFDILHNGHIEYLEKARRLGHRLIVAVNDDQSVTALKGSKRPFNKLYDRMQMLAALQCVTWVVSFKDLTPERLIGVVKPNVLLKGADYSIE